MPRAPPATTQLKGGATAVVAKCSRYFGSPGESSRSPKPAFSKMFPFLGKLSCWKTGVGQTLAQVNPGWVTSDPGMARKKLQARKGAGHCLNERRFGSAKGKYRRTHHNIDSRAALVWPPWCTHHLSPTLLAVKKQRHCYEYRPAGATPSLPSATRLTKPEGSPLGTAQATRPTDLQGHKARKETRGTQGTQALALHKRLLVLLLRGTSDIVVIRNVLKDACGHRDLGIESC